MADYTVADISSALDRLPLEAGDVVFTHSNIGFFGRPEGINDADSLCRAFARAVLDRIGPDGCLAVPAFTYSFPRKEAFDPDLTPSAMGMFAEWVRKHEDALRSVDPCYSVAALGGRAKEFTEDAPENSFGRDSFFDRFLRANGKVLNFNFDAGSTFVHYVERALEVPYRFDKTFSGTILQNGVSRRATSIISVRYLSDDALEAAFEGFDALAREQGVFYTARLGRGEVGLISADDTFGLIERTLPIRPWFLTKAERLGVASPLIIPE